MTIAAELMMDERAEVARDKGWYPTRLVEKSKGRWRYAARPETTGEQS